MIAQYLWQVHYQIFPIISLKEFIKFNVNVGMIIKNVKHVELHKKIVSAALNIQTFKMIYYYTNVDFVTGITKKDLMKV